ncbi:transcription factor bHLH126-like [Silene latifolia]|uniref:transcription factor bHLH126-like n=1 Tax=Silene latifolia TaxID=37657 RepID=UPI003D771A8E
MSDLLSSLRSLLPQEYVRGQTTSCDDLEEATNYIKSLEASIKELEDKRNVLLNKSRSNNNQHAGEIGSSSTSINDNYVTIHTFPRRLEIEISVKHEGGDGFPLSKLLKQVSLVEGINVVNCLTSKGDERWKCIIHCDLVNDQPTTDFSELQQRLASEISSSVA